MYLHARQSRQSELSLCRALVARLVLCVDWPVDNTNQHGTVWIAFFLFFAEKTRMGRWNRPGHAGEERLKVRVYPASASLAAWPTKNGIYWALEPTRGDAGGLLT